jgi:TolB protein
VAHVRSRGGLAVAALLALALAGCLASAAAAARAAPNGSIVFRRYLDADHTSGAIFTVAADGSGERQITRPPAGTVDDQPEWSPDGTSVTFTRCPADALCHVFTVAPDASGLQPLGPLCPDGANETVCPDDVDASFSPDSQTLALVQSTGKIRKDAYEEGWIEHSSIALVARDGSHRRVIYHDAPYSGDTGYPVFSPDGKRLVFERTGSPFTRNSGLHAVFVIGVDGKHLRRLTPWNESAGDNPDWSPDGRWIVFHSHVDQDGATPQMFLIHPDGSGRRQITHFPKGVMLGSSSFSPDGRSIVLGEGTTGGSLHVYTMGIDGSHLRRVTRSAHWDSAPNWGPKV